MQRVKTVVGLSLMAMLTAPVSGAAQSQAGKTGTGATAAGQEIAGVPVMEFAVGTVIALAIGVAVAGALSDNANSVSLVTTSATTTR